MNLDVPDNWQTKVLISTQTESSKNLQWEEFLYKNLPGKTVCFLLYVNDPSLVIGRFQNPWREVDLKKASAMGLRVLRRISGGGTVYHDQGNLNFSLIASKGFDGSAIFDFVCDSLNQLGLPVKKNDRGDLLLEDKKISGSAHAYGRTGSLHHGTLLIESDLTALKGVLHGALGRIETHAVSSHPSEVTNCVDHDSSVTIEMVKDFLVQNFLQSNSAGEVEYVCPENPGDQMSWERVFSQTPKFQYTAKGDWGDLSFVVENGFAKNINMKKGEQEISKEINLPWVRESLEAMELPYNFMDFLAEWLRWERI